jgi:hypothetical protein
MGRAMTREEAGPLHPAWEFDGADGKEYGFQAVLPFQGTPRFHWDREKREIWTHAATCGTFNRGLYFAGGVRRGGWQDSDGRTRGGEICVPFEHFERLVEFARHWDVRFDEAAFGALRIVISASQFAAAAT